jgi:hypothetical protein
MPEAAWITDWHMPGERFHDDRLEADYQTKHPVMSMLHPVAYGGGLVGAGLGQLAGGHPLVGMGVGLATGMGLEGLHRYYHLIGQQKQASNVPLEFIAVTPPVSGAFADHALERRYVNENPFLVTVHPGTWGGALAGAALGIAMRQRFGPHTPVYAMTAGASLGQLAEGAHRAHYLMEARRQALHQAPPIDPKLTLHQFHAG